MPAIAGTVQKVRAEAERLEVMDKAAGILAELLYTEKLLTQIKEYRSIMLHVSERCLHRWCKLTTNLCCSNDTDMSFTLLVPLLYLVYLHMPHTHTLSLSWTIAKARNTFWVHLRFWWGRCTQSSCPVCLTFSRLSMTMISWRKKPSWSGQIGCVFGCDEGSVCVCGEGGWGGVGGKDRCLSGCMS